jgi:hypothetical protein
MRVEFHPAARIEYVEAVEWYIERSVRTAESFVVAIEAVEASLHLPTVYSNRAPYVEEGLGARRILVPVFRKRRYQIVFVERGLYRGVVAVAHTALPPGYWVDRVKRFREE